MYSSPYGTFGNNSSYLADSSLPGVMIAVIVIGVIIAIVIGILLIVSYWKIFKKAGKNGWEAIVPFYNGWILTRVAMVNWLWFMVILIGGCLFGSNDNGISSAGYALTIVGDLVIAINIAHKFGKTTGSGVLCALLPFIGYPILAFGSAKYEG